MKTFISLDRFRIWLSIVILGIVVLCSFWVLEVMRKHDVQNTSNLQTRIEPDYYVENFNFIRLPNKGKINYRISGDRLIHRPRYDNFEILQPRINSFDENKTPLFIQADKAVIEQKNAQTAVKIAPRDSDEIHLFGHAKVTRPESPTTKYMELQSDYLLLLPDLNIMKTDKAVSLFSQNTETHAVGMFANNETQEVTLLSTVHIQIQPKK